MSGDRQMDCLCQQHMVQLQRGCYQGAHLVMRKLLDNSLQVCSKLEHEAVCQEEAARLQHPLQLCQLHRLWCSTLHPGRPSHLQKRCEIQCKPTLYGVSRRCNPF